MGNASQSHAISSVLLRLFLVVICLAVTVADAMSTPKTPSCAVVGVGVLGTNLCQKLLSSPKYAGSSITGITKTSTRHEAIREKMGTEASRLILLTADNVECSDEEKFQDVVFCAPPSGFEDYAGAVEDAVRNLWAGPQQGGQFVFTSSGGIYGSGDTRGGIVTEVSQIADITSNPRIAKLARAEQACLDASGCCLRLAGLYNLQRGAHNYWLTSGKEIAGPPNGLINLLHYEDAAGACLAALEAGPSVCKGKVFLISDSHPMTRKEICESSLKAKVYQSYDIPKFSVEDDETGPQGKTYDGSVSNQLLQWAPKYRTFDEFMASHG